MLMRIQEKKMNKKYLKLKFEKLKHVADESNLKRDWNYIVADWKDGEPTLRSAKFHENILIKMEVSLLHFIEAAD